MSGAVTSTAVTRTTMTPTTQVTLVDLLDRLLQGGIVIQGEITLAAADIDLVQLDLSILIAAVQTIRDR